MTATTLPPPRTPHPLAAVAAVLGVVVYFVALHALVVSRALPFLLLALVVAPWLVAGGSFLMRSERIAVSTPVRVTLLGVLVVALGVAAWRLAEPLARHADLVLYLENLVFLLVLCGVFAASLRPGRDALVTRLARIARHGDMPPAVIRYTRTVTMTWAACFALMAIVSTVLYATQPREWWSAFVNLAIGPLTIAVFVLEYVVRRLVLREVPHVPLMAGARAYREHARDKSA